MYRALGKSHHMQILFSTLSFYILNKMKELCHVSICRLKRKYLDERIRFNPIKPSLASGLSISVCANGSRCKDMSYERPGMGYSIAEDPKTGNNRMLICSICPVHSVKKKEKPRFQRFLQIALVDLPLTNSLAF